MAVIQSPSLLSNNTMIVTRCLVFTEESDVYFVTPWGWENKAVKTCLINGK